MKSVKIHFFSAINGEKTIVWKGFADFDEIGWIRFSTQTNETIEIAWTKTNARFRKQGETNLTLAFVPGVMNQGSIQADGFEFPVSVRTRSILVTGHTVDIAYEIIDGPEMPSQHLIHVDWITEGRNSHT